MSRNTTPGFRRLPRVADQMTAAHFDLVDQSLDAERAGDAARALELHASVPVLNKRSRHHVLLAQLAALGDELPGWVWARWMAYQAVRCEDPATETGRMQRLALKHAVETFHADQLADCHANGGDPVRVVAWVAAESWLFHQLLVHDLGGLTRFVDELVTGRLAEHAALARSWAGAPLGGYRVGASIAGGRLRIHDPGAGSSLEVLDLGAGRPRATRLGARPAGAQRCRRPPDVRHPADRRARAGGSRGVRAPEPWARVTTALNEGRLVEGSFMRDDYELTTDVFSIDLLRIGTAPADLDRVTAQLRSGRDEIPRAAFRILRRAADGLVQQSGAPHVAAAVLQPAALADARKMLLREGQHDVWLRWASLVHEPARGLLLELARACRAAG